MYCYHFIVLALFSLIASQSVFAGVPDSVSQPFQPMLLSSVPELDDVYGVAFTDIDNDDWPDLYLVRFRNLNRLFLNRDEGNRWIDRTIASQVGGNLYPGSMKNLELGVSVVDFDNDGYQDIGIFGWQAAFHLLHHTPGRLFKELPVSMDSINIDANCGAWSDIDKNGYLDVYITNEHGPNLLLMNEGFLSFRNQTEQFGLSDSAVSQGAVFADFNNDGWDDLIVCNWFSPDLFYLNQGGKSFRRIQLDLPHFENAYRSNSAGVGDLDNDGDPDLVMCDRDGHTQIYRNTTDSASQNIEFLPWLTGDVINLNLPAYGATIADVDNNGWNDIIFTNIGQNLLYLNYQGTFHLVQFEKNLYNRPVYSTGSAVADIDKDGLLDLFIGNKDTSSVFYKNTLPGHPFLRIKLKGSFSNWDALGSKVRLYRQTEAGKEQVFYAQHISGNGYLSVSEKVIHIGVKPDELYTIVVEFPSGRKRIRENIFPNQTVIIEEATGLISIIRAYFHLLATKILQPEFPVILGNVLFILLILVLFIRTGLKRYEWSNRLISIYMAMLFGFLFLIFWIFRYSPFQEILLIQSGFLLVIGLILFIFHEKLHRSELKKRQNRQLLLEFSKDVIFYREKKLLYSTLLSKLVEVYHLPWGACYAIADEKWVLLAQTGSIGSLPEEIILPHHVIQTLRNKRVHPETEITRDMNAILKVPVSALITLSTREQMQGFIVIPPATHKLKDEDIHIFDILGNQTSLALENMMHLQKSEEAIKKLTESRVREQYIRELEQKNLELQSLYKQLQETQAQLIQNEKMVSLGQLIAGVAHEINNPISFVHANLQELKNAIDFITGILKKMQSVQLSIEKAEKDEIDFLKNDLPALISESIEGTRRVKEIVTTLRKFSREDVGEVGPVNIPEGIESALLILKNEWKNRITIHKDIEPNLEIEGNQNELNQVFLNMLHNAILAIEGNGDIFVSATRGDDHVVISIKDTGKGIQKEYLSKIFDPFFTLRPVGEGTGLGLSISYSIIQKHRGRIEVKSEPGKGSEFVMTLPVQQPKEF